MTPVMQTRFYDPTAPAGQQRGNCWNACIASLLDLPIEDVPDFVQIEVDGGPSYWDPAEQMPRPMLAALLRATAKTATRNALAGRLA